MNRTRTTVTAVAALLVLAGCGAGDGASDPAPDPGATSAPASSDPTSSAPTSTALLSTAASTTNPTTSASGPAPASTSGVLSLVESCRAVLDDQQSAETALRTYVKNPLDAKVDVQDLDRLRSELRAGELSAPEPPRQELTTQVGVLESVVQGIRDGKVPRADLDAFRNASEKITTVCDSATR